MEKTCISCGANLLSEPAFVEFQCPSCGEATIGRCAKCKTLANEYKCPKCGFAGP